MSIDDEPRKNAVSNALESRTLQEFFEHAKHLTTTALGFPRNKNIDIAYYTSQQIFDLAQQVAQTYLRAGLPQYPPPTTVVGLRVVSTIEWVVSFIALVRLGYTVMVLSPTLAPEKVRLLMDKADCSIVIDGTSMIDEDIGEEFRKTLKSGMKTVIRIATLESLARNKTWTASQDTISKVREEEQLDFSRIEETHPVLILHSSGSTGLPKLVQKTHATVLDRLRGLLVGLDGTSLVGSKLYNIVGLHSMLYSLIRENGASVWFNELIPADALQYRDMLVELQPQTMWFTPSNLVNAMSTSEGLEVLVKSELVLTTGGVFPTRLGQQLIEAGVNLVNIYGSTELSVDVRLLPSARKRGDPDREYMEPDISTASHITFHPLSNTTSKQSTTTMYELIILPNHPSQETHFANQPDGSFHTGDLFLQHPTRPGLYKCIGRMTDEIKIRPVGHENLALHAPSFEDIAMASSPGVLEEAVLFGSGRPEAGMLLFVKNGRDGDREGVVGGVWEALERGFEEGGVAVRVRREMLVVVCGGVVPRTGKGNFVRSEIYGMFEGEINEAYALI